MSSSKKQYNQKQDDSMKGSQNLGDSGYQDSISSQSNITESFFLELLHIEQQIVTGTYTLNDVNRAIEMYAKCVEYFDSFNNPVSAYFAQKIQYTLANQQTILKLLNVNETDPSLQTSNNEIQNQNTNMQSSQIDQQVDTNQFYGGYADSNDQLDNDGAEKKEDRKGLKKMLEDIKKRKEKKTNNYQDLKTQHYIRQRQMQLLMEAQKEYKEVAKNGKDSQEGAREGQRVGAGLKNTNQLWQENAKCEEQNDVIIKEDIKIQETALQKRIQQRKQKMLEKKRKQEEEEQQKQANLQVFSEKKENKRGSIDLTDEKQTEENYEDITIQNEDDNQQQNFRGKKSSEKHLNVSDINLQDDSNTNNNNLVKTTLKQQRFSQQQQQETIHEEDQEEDIEHKLMDFKNYSKNLRIPQEMSTKLRTASNLQDLDKKILEQMNNLIDDFERKTSKSMCGPELQSLVAKGANKLQFLEENTEGTSIHSSAPQKYKAQKLNRRNNSAQIDTSKFNQKGNKEEFKFNNTLEDNTQQKIDNIIISNETQNTQQSE